ncbi:MAG: hypothetical protein Q4P30_05410 [Eubacteriales bacterium]|nr:hypothetical protein [Eubacteriales bacterium]
MKNFSFKRITAGLLALLLTAVPVLTGPIVSAANYTPRTLTLQEGSYLPTLDNLDNTITATGDANVPEHHTIYKTTVPVRLWKAYEPNASMGNGALLPEAEVSLDLNGNGVFEIKLVGLKFLGMYGHVWGMYYNPSAPDDVAALDNKTDRTPVPVLNNRLDKSLDKRALSAEDIEKLPADYPNRSEAEGVYVMNFPHTFRFPMANVDMDKYGKEAFDYSIPIVVNVDAMDSINAPQAGSDYNELIKHKGAGEQKARLQFDLVALKREVDAKLANDLQLAIDRLQSEIASCEALTADDYTAESFAKLTDALQAAKPLVDTTAATEIATINTAIENLQAARNELVAKAPVIDKTALQQAVKDAKAVSGLHLYTDETVKAFNEALNSAETLLADDNATQAAVNAAANTLNGAKNALAKKPVEVNTQAFRYKVPVRLWNYHEDKASMGNPAVVKTAILEIDGDGNANFIITIEGMAFMGMYGHVWDMYYVDTNNRVEVLEMREDNSLVKDHRMEFPYRFKLVAPNFDRSKLGKDSEFTIGIEVCVDAMDAIKSGGATSYDQITQGSGKQKARVIFDLSKAEALLSPIDWLVKQGLDRSNIISSDDFKAAIGAADAATLNNAQKVVYAPVEDKDVADVDALKAAIGNEKVEMKQYDINMVDMDGKAVQPNGTVRVAIQPDDVNFADKVYAVYRHEADGSVTKLDVKAENGIVSFETDHFSLYTLVAKVATSGGIEPGRGGQPPRRGAGKGRMARTGAQESAATAFALMALVGLTLAATRKNRKEI